MFHLTVGLEDISLGVRLEEIGLDDTPTHPFGFTSVLPDV